MGTPVTVQMIMDTVGWPHPKPKDATGLLLWEDTHELLDCYLWLKLVGVVMGVVTFNCIIKSVASVVSTNVIPLAIVQTKIFPLLLI